MEANSSPAALDKFPGARIDGASESRVVLVLTASGTRYRFDLASGTVRGMRAGVADLPSFELRRNGQEIPVLGLEPVVVGSPMTMQLALRADGVPTLRSTSEVISVTLLGPMYARALT